MYLMIDNYDSFVYNLVTYFKELGCELEVVRNDKVQLEDIHKALENDDLDGIIISPGPKSPSDCGLCCQVVEEFQGKVPILGVCLGHQIIGHVYGAGIKKGNTPVHGKVTRIYHDEKGLFENLDSPYMVTRYHSLIVGRDDFPDTLEINGETEDNVIMAISHKKYPIYGVQFHPEAVLTENGHELLENFVEICREWKNKDEN